MGIERLEGDSRRFRRRKTKRETTTTARNATLPTTAPIIVASGPGFELAPIIKDVAVDDGPLFDPVGERVESVLGVMVKVEVEGDGVGVVEVGEREAVAPTFRMEEEDVADAPNSAKRHQLNPEYGRH